MSFQWELHIRIVLGCIVMLIIGMSMAAILVYERGG